MNRMPIQYLFAGVIVFIVAMYAFFGPREEPRLEIVIDQKYTTADRYWMSICVYHESRGEPMEAQVAVAQVIMNRMDSRILDAAGVIFEPSQFSWANQGNRPPIKEYHSMLQSLLSVDLAIEQRRLGNTMGGAEFFFDDSIDMPSWADGMEHVGTIGRLMFYRLP